MLPTIYLVLVLLIVLPLTVKATQNTTVTTGVDTIGILQFCSELVGRKIDTGELGRRVSIRRVSDSGEQERISVPGAIAQNMISIHVSDFPLPLTSDGYGNDKVWNRDYDLYIDDQSMRLIKIVSTTAGWIDSVGRSSFEVRTLDSILLSKTIQFEGYPDTVETTLLSALRNCPFSPHFSPYISLRYINSYEYTEDSIIPVWVVCLIGAPTWKTVWPRDENDSKIDYFRVVIDARTGMFIRGGN